MLFRSCIESGFIQNEIQNSAYQFQKDVESKDQIIVGVNSFIQQSESEPEILKISEEVVREQIERLRVFKGKRNPSEIDRHLQLIKKSAQTDQNLMPIIVDAVKADVTLGEVSDTLRSVFGRFKETITI